MSSERRRKALSFAPMLIPVLFVLPFDWMPVQTYCVLRHALATGAFSVVERPIADYEPWVPHERGESFVVRGIVFSMWNSHSQAFDDMPIQLRDGQQVRIAHVGDAIVKVELVAPTGARSRGRSRHAR